ncbi:helix-turn-helix domain-containing protein [Metabacillus sp. HB246100]
MSTIGQRIKSLREKHEYSQEYIGEKFGLTKYQVSRFENGKTKIDPDLINKFADFYNVSTDYIYGRTENPTPYYVDVLKKARKENDDKEGIIVLETEKFSIEEIEIIEEIKKHPALFHDLSNNPQKKIKQLIRMWEFIKKDLDDDDDDENVIED